MGRIIVKLEGYYFEWSTVVDAPVTFGMSLEEFKEHYRDEYGRDGMRDLDSRLRRVEEYGTSNYQPMSAKELIETNRAGPDEAELTIAEIYQAYCLREPIRDGWRVPEVQEEG